MSSEKLTDGQTDRKRCIGAHRATCTGGLKNGSEQFLLEKQEFIRAAILTLTVGITNAVTIAAKLKTLMHENPKSPFYTTFTRTFVIL